MFFHKMLRALGGDSAGDAARTADPTAARVLPLGGSNHLVRGRHGLFLASDNDLYIGGALLEYGEYSELEWALLQRYCAPGNTVVEVGANIGAHTVSLAKAVGTGGGVFAIEPQPVVFQRLCANIALNDLQNVRTLNCGCGASAATMHVPLMDLEEAGNFGGVQLERQASESSVPVDVKTLDTLLNDARIDLIKIDVEGMERDVLLGSAQTISRYKPALYVENGSLDASRPLIETLLSLGYHLWWHTPPLFNPDNFFGSTRNLYERIGSPNMLGIHRESSASRPDELERVSDAGYHPFRKGAAT